MRALYGQVDQVFTKPLSRAWCRNLVRLVLVAAGWSFHYMAGAEKTGLAAVLLRRKKATDGALVLWPSGLFFLAQALQQQVRAVPFR